HADSPRAFRHVAAPRSPHPAPRTPVGRFAAISVSVSASIRAKPPPRPHISQMSVPTSELPTRSDALALIEEFTPSESLRKHMLSVEAAMRAYAEHYGEDPERWGLAGLIHDFDYERYPNATRSATEEHPAWGVNFLRERGWPEDILQAILGHAIYSG